MLSSCSGRLNGPSCKTPTFGHVESRQVEGTVSNPTLPVPIVWLFELARKMRIKNIHKRTEDFHLLTLHR